MSKNIEPSTKHLFDTIVALVETARSKVAVFLNSETTLLYWNIGSFIKTELKQKGGLIYGKQNLVTLSQQLTLQLGKGFSYSALPRMVKVADCFYSFL